VSETLLILLPDWGAALLLVGNFLACIALPIPASLIMLAAGAFIAAGDLQLVPVLTAAWSGAVAGDQTGYFIGRRGGGPLLARLSARRGAAKMVTRATASLNRHAGLAVFLSRWLISPLGPYVNFAAGAAQVSWLRFSLPGAAGEVIWVGLYIGLGWFFAGQVADLGQTTTTVGLALAAAVLAFLLGRMLWRAAQPATPD